MILFILWSKGDAIWQGPNRYIMAGIAVLGSGILAVTGTLGGHLIGVYSELVDVLRFFGWEVYTTFYLPTWTLIVVIAAALVLVILGVWGGRHTERRSPD
jgi:hypothetical protein